MKLNKVFTPNHSKLFIKHGIAQYYRLGVLLENKKSIQALTQFIKSNNQANSDQFYNIFIRYLPSTHNDLQEFLTEYIKRGFDLEAIVFDNWGKIKNKTIFMDSLSWFIPLINDNKWYQWNLLTLSIRKDPISILKSIKCITLNTKLNYINQIIDDMNLNYTSEGFSNQNPINSDSWYRLKLLVK